MKVRFEHNLSHNYMIPEPEDTIDVKLGEEFQIPMLTENEIPGLMKCSRRQIDGKDCFYYEITSRQSLAQRCESQKLRAQEVRTILRCLYQTLQGLSEYLLDADRILLDPELIYLDIETLNTAFCYYPCRIGNLAEAFRGFASYLLYHLDQEDAEAVLMVYELNREIQAANYSILEVLQKGMDGKAKPFPKPELTAPQQPLAEQTQTVPGRQQTPPQREQSASETCTTDTQKRMTGKSAIMRRQPAQKSKKKEEQTEKKKRWLIKAGVTILAAAAALGAVALGLLTVTQAGGVTFLAAGVAACLLADEKKKNPKNGEIRDRQKSEKKKLKLPDGIFQKKKAQEKPLVVQTDWTAEESMPPHPQKTAEKRQKSERQADTQVGMTTVLREGTEEYRPHLTLLSMDQRERISVALIQESYTIGKLKSKVDVYLDDPAISRIHAKIQKEGETYWLCDMNSTNGTFLNGERLGVNEKVPIDVGDEITFAQVGFYVGNC